jgi:hypothetical protein
MIRTEKHIAVVANTDDPEKRFRIKVKCAALLGSEDVVLNRWVEPAFNWGMILLPDIDEQVEIEINAGSDKDEVEGQSFLENPDIRWRGTRYQGPDAYESMFTDTNYGKRRGFVTPAGHILMFDDTEGSEKINLVWHSAENGYAMFSMNEDGSIILANKNGSMLYLNAANREMALIDEHGNSFSSASTGIKIIDATGNIIELKDGAIQVLGQGGVTISCTDCVLDAGKVQIGGQPVIEPAVLGTMFATLFSGHIHPTAMGPSGPPVPGVPIPVVNTLSLTTFLK